MKKYHIGAAVIAVVLSACVQRFVTGDVRVFERTSNATNEPAFPDVLKLIVSEDAMHYAICYETAGKYFVFSDGGTRGPFEEVGGVEFSGNTLWYSYRSGREWSLVLGARQYGPFGEVLGASVAPGGVRTSYAFRDGSETGRAVGDRVFGGCDSLGDIYWFDNGYLYGYAKGGSNFVWINGESFYQGEYPIQPVVSASGSNYGFVYKVRDSYYFRVGSTNFGPYDSAWGPVFDPSGRRFGLYYRNHDDAYVYISGIGHRGPFDMAGMPEFDASGKRYSYWFLKDGREYVCIDGTNYGGYQFASGGYFSADGKTAAFRFVQNGSYGINRNGTVLYTKPMQRFDSWSAGLKISDDGSRIAFWYMLSNREYFEVNGRTYGGCDSLGRSEAWQDSLTFSGTNFAYWYNDGDRDGIVIDGTSAGEGYIEAGMPFLANSGSLKVFWYKKDDAEYIYVNGENLGPYEAATFRYTPDGKLFIASIENGKFSMKEWKLRP